MKTKPSQSNLFLDLEIVAAPRDRPRWARRRCGRPQSRRGLTRMEVLVVVAVLGLLFTVAWPVLAGSRERTLRVLCVDNLRQLGQGLQQWGMEHGGRVPWRTPWCESGTLALGSDCPGVQPSWLQVGLNQNSWFQWHWISNEIRTPRILACPSDTAKRAARDWSRDADGGFLHGRFQNNAVSYFAGLDVLPNDSTGLLAGDRNIQFNLVSGGGSCSSGIRYNGGLTLFNFTGGFTSALHGESGNLLFTDGRVEELSGEAARRRLAALYPNTDNNSLHYLVP